MPHQLYCSFCLFLLITLPLSAEPQKILSDKWLKPNDLDMGIRSIQEHIDKGKAMNFYASAQARVLEAKLLILYIKLYQSLPPHEQARLYQEQETWWIETSKTIENRYKDTEEGSGITLDRINDRINSIETRMEELEKRLKIKGG